MSTILMILSWDIFSFSAHYLIGLIVGAILVDLRMQALHITNHNIIFSKNPEARNRVNTIYMVGFFLGGAIGTTLGAIAWQHYACTGVSLLGFIFTAGILVAHLMEKIGWDK